MKILDVGCGPYKTPGAIGIDRNPESKADVIHDLEVVPYPFPDNEFDEIVCSHVLEHVDDVVKVVEEIHRIGKPGGRVLVKVPHFSSVFAFSDPTHRHFFSTRSFDYFVDGTDVSSFHYSAARFRIVRVEFPPPVNAGFLKRAMFGIINRWPRAFEKRFAFLLPRHLLEFDLEIVK